MLLKKQLKIDKAFKEYKNLMSDFSVNLYGNNVGESIYQLILSLLKK